jgi:hypothetical protein
MRGSHLLFVMIFIAMFAAKNDAQTLTVERHLPYTTDSLLVYKLPYIEVSDSGKHCVWDFSNLSTDSAEMIGVDYYAHSANDTAYIGCHREHANYFYHHWLDTLWQTGYETSHTHVRYSVPIPLLRFPFTYGDSICAQFTGTGQYCHIMSFHIDGTCLVRADAMGSLMLPEIEIDSVFRTYTLQQYVVISHDTTHVTEKTYRWYSSDIGYPLLETSHVAICNSCDTVETAHAYYLYQEMDKFNKKKTYLLQTEEHIDSLVTGISCMPNPVQTDLHISYQLANYADVYISIHYNGGASMYATTLQRQEEGVHNVTINMASFPIGSYVVYLHVNNMVYSTTIIKI